MENDRKHSGGGPRPSRKMGWIIGAVLIGLLVLLSIYGIVAGTGDAVGVTEAAPGDDNARPAADEIGDRPQR